VYPTFPIPSDVETRAIFYDAKGLCCTGILNSIKFQFEDYFLPIYIPPIYKPIYKEQGKLQLLEILFKNFWTKLKINQQNKNNHYINSFRLLDIPKEEIIKVVNSRLGPFLVNQNFLDLDYIVKNPYHNDSIETSETADSKGNYRLCSYYRFLEDIKFLCKKIKNYYDSKTDKFKNNTYDFAIDEYLEKNSNLTEVSDIKTNHSIYNLAKVLIFVPEK